MAKSFKRGKVSRKSLRKGKKSLRRGKGSRKSVKRSKGFRKMYGGSPLTDFLIKTDNKKLTSVKYLNDSSLINEPTEEGLTPLHVLCLQNSLKSDIVEMLIKNGADVNAETTDEHKDTPLDVLMLGKSNYHWISYEPFKEIMTLLLKNGGLYEIKKLEKDKQNYILNVERKILAEKERQKESFKIGEDETANPLHKR